jgi:hypothetical protein
MCVRVVLSRAVVVVPLRRRIEGCQPFQPTLVIFMQSSFVIVDEYAGRDVHRVDQAKAFLHSAGSDLGADILSDVYECSAPGHVESEVLGM